jgi:hypothetical protein
LAVGVFDGPHKALLTLLLRGERRGDAGVRVSVPLCDARERARDGQEQAGIGAVDLGLVGILAVYGAPLSTAAAAVLIYRAIFLWVRAETETLP